MSGKQYLKNQLAVILINLLGMLALALFLIASGNNIQTVLFILVVWLLVLASCLLFFFFTRKKALDTQATASYSQPMAMPYISMTSWWPLPLPVCRNRRKAF